MLEYKNKLSKFPSSKKYLEFGLKQAESVNEKFKNWYYNQAFFPVANSGISSEFSLLTLDGHSDHIGIGGNGFNIEYEDRVQWQLNFLGEIKNEKLSEALLHEKRLPNITTFNSAPYIFDTANYIQIGVSNGKIGWVKKGEFPKSICAKEDYDAVNKALSSGKPLEKTPIIGVQTDVRREALAGFEAAYYWQCFRAMIVDCSDVLHKRLKEEISEMGKIDYNKSEFIRSRSENVYPFFVSFFPDVRLKQNKSTSLKKFYHPGALEATIALELENGFYHQFGGSDSSERPIFSAKGFPIEVSGNDKKYDARIKFQLNPFGSSIQEDEQTQVVLSKTIRKKYNNFSIDKEGNFIFTFDLKNANKIEQEIREGSKDTSLHVMSRVLVENLRLMHESLNEWYEKKIPALEEEHQVAILNRRHSHFLGLEKNLK
ncbi:MAG: hypothetical protein WC812_00925 [Candidatus Pacearchaeota archaeon]|jgi:hypothetical protein